MVVDTKDTIIVCTIRCIFTTRYVQVYPDDFGEFVVRVTNRYGTAQMAGFVIVTINISSLIVIYHLSYQRLILSGQVGWRVPTW